MIRLRSLALLLWLAAAATAQVALFEGLGEYHRPVSTASPEAQRYWDQGFIFYQGFNHGTARQSFARAAELDPACAMAHWGLALSLGPHINYTLMTPDEEQAATEAIARARATAAGATPVERALIEALATRYRFPAVADRRPLDEAYAAAMRAVYEQYPADADVGALYAEALMNLWPWDLWSPEGEPRPDTPTIVAVLEHVLEVAPDHPFACHLYIHAVEASPEPGRALAAANRLRPLVPGVAHLVHMPSHIDIRLGRYEEAIAANERAIVADETYLRRTPSLGLHSMYRAHDYHFVVYAAMFRGQSELALRRARDLAQVLPLELVVQHADFLDGFAATVFHVLVRFGRWEEILAEPEPEAKLPVTSAFYHYARGLAFSSLGLVDQAAVELAAYDAARAAVPETSYIGNNASSVVLEIGRHMLAGELEYRRGNVEQGFALLRQAVAADEALRYDEPWGWMQPAAHALGALLLEQGRLEEAEQVYRADLARHAGNGWSLHGLAESLRRQGKADEAAETDRRFAEAWASADVELRASCFCRLE